MVNLWLCFPRLSAGRPGRKSGGRSVKLAWWLRYRVTSAASISSALPTDAAKTAPGHWPPLTGGSSGNNPIPPLIFFARACCGLLRRCCAPQQLKTGAQIERYSPDTMFTGEKSPGFWLGWSACGKATPKNRSKWWKSSEIPHNLQSKWGIFHKQPDFGEKSSFLEIPNIRFRGFCPR